MSKNTLLLSVQEFKDRSQVHKNMDDTLIFCEIKVAQDTRIQPAIGTKLLEKLQEGIEGGNLGTVETQLLEGYILDALVQFTLAALPITSGFQFFTKGGLQRGSENASTMSMSDMVAVSQHYENRGEFYRERLIRYLRVHSSVFPEYEDRSCDNDMQPERSGYSVPCWLGDD